MDNKFTEHILFQDIPCGRNGRFHSAVLTTYSMDLIHFDSHLRNVLHHKQICSINIFADADQINNSLEYTGPQYMRNIGCDYCVTSVSATGAFHPKISFFAGDDCALVLVGSGNLTVPGHGKNHEVFTGFMVDGDNRLQYPLVSECWHYIKRLAEKHGGFEAQRITREIPVNCEFLKEAADQGHHRLWNISDGLAVAMLYHEEDSSILRQISELIPLDDIVSITVVSPFFDEDGSTLATLAEICPNAQVRVVIQKSCDLPPCTMDSNPRIEFYDFDETERGRDSIKNFKRERMAHVKLFHFATKLKEYCMIGSPNATRSGLGTLSHRGANEEFGVLYVSENKDFLSMLGLKPKKTHIIRPQTLKRIKSSQEKRPTRCIELHSAIYRNKLLEISYEIKGELPPTASLVIDDGISPRYFAEIAPNGNNMSMKISLGKGAVMCYVSNTECEILSNKIFINRIDLLDATNPSKGSRAINQFLSKIETDGYEGLEIADMLVSVMWSVIEDSSESIALSYSSSGMSKQKEKEDLPVIDFNDVKDNATPSVMRMIDGSSSRLVDCVEESIRKHLRMIDEDLNDEEESGCTVESNVRAHEASNDIPVTRKNYSKFAKIATRVLSDFCKLIDKRTAHMYKRGNGFVRKDDLNFFCLSMFTAIEICAFDKMRYNFGIMDSLTISIHQKKLFYSLEQCIVNDCLNTLEKFALFCRKHGSNIPVDDDFMECAHRAIRYAIVYASVFYNSTSHSNSSERRIDSACKCLIAQFGLPDMDKFRDDIAPLSERYGRVVSLRNIENTLKKIGFLT